MKCTTCGAQVELDHDRKTGFCKACNNTFVVSHGEHLSHIEIDKTKDLKNNRQLLDKAVGNDDIDAILRFSDQIRKIIPDDYVANYFHAYAAKKKHNPRYMNIFYQSFLFEATERDIDRVCKHIIDKSDLRDYKQVKNYLSYVRKKKLEAYENAFNERKRLEDNFASIPRDAFICHRSTDGTIASNVVEVLEADGYTCWISSRNLRPNDNENYWRNIKDAIEKCSIFLVVSSQDAMLSNDVQREIEYAQNLEKPKLEFKIDTTPHTSLFKYFFDGIKWIDGYTELSKGLEALKERFFDKKLQVKKATQHQAAQKVEKRSKDQNYLVRAAVENEQGHDSTALDFIEKALDINVESPEAWWLKFLVKHHFKSTKEFDGFLQDTESFANVYEILESNEYITAKKFSNTPEYFKKNAEMLEQKLENELKTIVSRKNKADLNYFLELRPDHEKLKWYDLLFSFEIYSENTLDKMIENEQYLVALDKFFNASRFESFIESTTHTAKYLKYKDRFESFKTSLGEKRVNRLFSYEEKIKKTTKKITELLKKEKFAKAAKRVKKLKSYGMHGEYLYHYYSLLTNHEFKSESAMFESLSNTANLNESLALLKSKDFKQLKESQYHETLVKNIEETIDTAKRKAVVEVYQNKINKIEKKYYKKYYLVNFIIGLSMISVVYMLMVYFNDTLDYPFENNVRSNIEFIYLYIHLSTLSLGSITVFYTAVTKERKRKLKKSSYDHKEPFNFKGLRTPFIMGVLLPVFYLGFLSLFIYIDETTLLLSHEIFIIYQYVLYFVLIYLYYRLIKTANYITGKIFPEKTRFRLLVLPFIMVGLVYFTILSVS